MNTSAVNPSQTAFLSGFGFNLAFFIGLGVGFLLGILASYIGNILWDRHVKKKMGSEPFVNISASSDMIHYEGQMPNTAQSQSTLLKTIQKTFPIEK